MAQQQEILQMAQQSVMSKPTPDAVSAMSELFRLLESGHFQEAEGRVLHNYYERGSQLEAERHEAATSFHIAATALPVQPEPIPQPDQSPDLERGDVNLDGDDTVDQNEHRPEIKTNHCLLYTSPSPRDRTRSRMPSSA